MSIEHGVRSGVVVVVEEDMDTTPYHTIDQPQPGLGGMIIIGNCTILKVS